MTETPETPPTETEQDAQATANEVTAQTELSYADHHTYSNALYDQPAWVVDAVFASQWLDPSEKYTQAQVQSAIDQMMATPDSQFEPEAPPVEAQ